MTVYDNLQTQINTNTAAISALQGQLGGKALQTDMTALQATVSGKVDHSEFDTMNTTVAGLATQASVAEIEADLGELQPILPAAGTYGYDTNTPPRLISTPDGTSYTYDNNGRISTITNGTTTRTITYNADNTIASIA